MMNNLVCTKLKGIINLQDIIKTDEVHYKSKRRKVCNFSKYADEDEEQRKIATKSKNLDKG